MMLFLSALICLKRVRSFSPFSSIARVCSSSIFPRIPHRTGYSEVGEHHAISDGGFPCVSNGIVKYDGYTKLDGIDRWFSGRLVFKPLTDGQLFQTRWKLWRQLPWKKIKGKVILKVQLSGSLSIEASSSMRSFNFGSSPNLALVDSLADMSKLLTYAAVDPRVLAIMVNIGPLTCGYAKLIELRRAMDFFTQSKKEIIGYCEGGSAKEYFIGLGCNEIFVPPEGNFDLRGFSASATFLRGLFDKVGIEPQVQRLGKYKSAGDTFNRDSISDAQREVISSLLMEASDYWLDRTAERRNKSVESIISELWNSDSLLTPHDLVSKGYISGVKYLDQVELYLRSKYRTEQSYNIIKEFLSLVPGTVRPSQGVFQELLEQEQQEMGNVNLSREFEGHPRRAFEKNSSVASKYTLMSDTTVIPPEYLVRGGMNQSSKSSGETSKANLEKQKAAASMRAREPNFIPANVYLKKMRRGDRILEGLRVIETNRGPRIAIINAVGAISTGRSGSSGLSGRTLGSDSLIEMVQRAKSDRSITAVVLRVDSPGGSALASDLMWRELRLLAREKPVVASMVDVAASGGYYLSMACDVIVAEDLTVTGSIGVVTAKFNAKELFGKIGYNVELLSRGRFAELLTTSREFTAEEQKYFEQNARQAYQSFVAKAAASRSKSVEELDKVAQGRVWTGRQALQRGLVDQVGGLATALEVAATLANVPATDKLRVQTMTEPRRGLGFLFGQGASSALTGFRSSASSRTAAEDVMAVCDPSVATTEMASAESLGMGPSLANLGLLPYVAYSLAHSASSRKMLQDLFVSHKDVGTYNPVWQAAIIFLDYALFHIL